MLLILLREELLETLLRWWMETWHFEIVVVGIGWKKKGKGRRRNHRRTFDELEVAAWLPSGFKMKGDRKSVCMRSSPYPIKLENLLTCFMMSLPTAPPN